MSGENKSNRREGGNTVSTTEIQKGINDLPLEEKKQLLHTLSEDIRFDEERQRKLEQERIEQQNHEKEKIMNWIIDDMKEECLTTSDATRSFEINGEQYTLEGKSINISLPGGRSFEGFVSNKGFSRNLVRESNLNKESFYINEIRDVLEEIKKYIKEKYGVDIDGSVKYKRDKKDLACYGGEKRANGMCMAGYFLKELLGLSDDEDTIWIFHNSNDIKSDKKDEYGEGPIPHNYDPKWNSSQLVHFAKDHMYARVFLKK